jgi:FAD dependent oxidoreductase
VDGTDGRSVSKGMMQGRREVTGLFSLMRKYFPGFANARIRSIAPVLGIRETRRIVGDFVYTVEDLVDARDFKDTIGFSGYWWDLPDPRRPSSQPMEERKVAMPRLYTPIPYRVMVPRPIRNVICPGRSISVERDVLGPLREQAPCYAMGHAAGLAAAQVAHNCVSFASVDVSHLRADLKAQGAIVDWETT